MKKFYSILSLSILSLAFSGSVSAQAQNCADGAILASVEGSNWPGSTNCRIVVLAPAEWFGGAIEAYIGAGSNLTIGTATWTLSGTGTRPARGVISFPCDQVGEPFISVEVKLNGNVCINQIAFNAPLPIKLSAFNANLQGSGVVLNWTSELESMASHYGVEKSGDGKNFNTIGTVKAAGNSANPLKYSFDDKNFAGTGYYRLKLVDLDGKNSYSKVVYVNGGSGASTTLSVFPNPFRSDVQLKGINASDVNKNNIRVFNVAGKEVSYSVTGANSIAIDANLPKGVYILQVKDLRYKLVKE
ncbi:T9SS type A sorting domain-containing protein [Flavitalea sp.]|nr:T9SS type A sorting domain-containing protein [Flavitalea sp.]